MPVLGIAGKPNVGKSTFFSASTLATVDIANYPFTTKVANVGITYVRVPCVCREFGVTDNPSNSICVNGTRLVPVKLIDTPGLVPGAWQGKGLGNQFLDDTRRADALLLIVDASGGTDSEGRPSAPGTFDPIEDIQFLENEFDMWLLQIIKKDWEKLARKAETTKENIAIPLLDKLAGLQISKHHITQALSDLNLANRKPTSWTEQDLAAFARSLRKVSKPLVIVANKIDVPPAEQNFKKMQDAGYEPIPCSAEAELALRRAAEKLLIQYTPGDSEFRTIDTATLNEKQKQALERIESKILQKWKTTGVQTAINDAYLKLLGMIAIFPVEDAEKLSDHKGRILPDCYLVPAGITAKEFAGVIHSELAESFIYAIDVRGRKRIGEDHLLENRDVIKIVAGKARG